MVICRQFLSILVDNQRIKPIIHVNTGFGSLNLMVADILFVVHHFDDEEKSVSRIA